MARFRIGEVRFGPRRLRQAPSVVFDDEVRVPHDASAANWIAPLLGDFGTVGGLVPAGFENYLVIPHQPPGASGDWTAPLQLVAQVASVLAMRTSTPDVVWFATWEGYGFLDPVDLEALPHFELPHRRYYLGTAAAGAASRIHAVAHPCPPDLWWPEDRSWFVATDTDLSWTYLGADGLVCEAVQAALPWRAQPVAWSASNAEAGRVARSLA